MGLRNASLERYDFLKHFYDCLNTGKRWTLAKRKYAIYYKLDIFLKRMTIGNEKWITYGNFKSHR